MAALLGLNLVRNLIVICCNGGLPYVDLHLYPKDSFTFENLDPTDWVATDTSGSQFINSTLVDIPPGADMRMCDVYNLTLSSPFLEEIYDQRNGSLSCRCPKYYHGASCQLHISHQTGHRSTHSFRIFVLVALIPLGFALFAAVGGFLLKLCCLDIFTCTLPCSNKYDAAFDDDDEQLDENTINHCLEKARQRDQQQRQRGSNPAESESFLPTVSGHLPEYYPMRGSPPPSYKSATPSIAEDRQSFNDNRPFPVSY